MSSANKPRTIFTSGVNVETLGNGIHTKVYLAVEDLSDKKTKLDGQREDWIEKSYCDKALDFLKRLYIANEHESYEILLEADEELGLF